MEVANKSKPVIITMKKLLFPDSSKFNMRIMMSRTSQNPNVFNCDQFYQNRFMIVYHDGLPGLKFSQEFVYLAITIDIDAILGLEIKFTEPKLVTNNEEEEKKKKLKKNPSLMISQYLTR